MVDGRGWVSALPARLDSQRRALTDLLLFCETSPAVTSLSVGCSLGRGAGDELSDVDAAVGVGAARGAAGADRVRDVERALVDHLDDGRLVDVLRDESPPGQPFIRRVLAQLTDGVQLDLAVIAEAEVRRGDAAPDFVTLYVAAGSAERFAGSEKPSMPSAYDVVDEQVRGWAFRGWWALLDVDKYLRRGSRWEAHQRLHEARQHIWALWATGLGTSYPWHGLSQVLDHQPASLPAGIEATVSGLDLDDLRSALRASASVLDDVSRTAARRCGTTLPTGLAEYARGVLGAGQARGGSDGSTADAAARSPSISGTELAVYGPVTSRELRTFLDTWARRRLGSPIASVRFRAGRIDVVWGVELEDGRAVVIKTHRPPVDLAVTRAAGDAQRLLSDAGFPCAVPLAGPDEVDGRVLTAETLVDGATPDGRDPAGRRLLAEGLARHIEILRDRPDLVSRAGQGPSWCRYQGGPWPVPHDSLVDFRSTPAGYEWLDDVGRRAADQVLAHRDDEPVVVGHADWYAGNTVAAGGVLTGTFDWELVADTEAVIAGFAAACFASSSTSGGGLSTPDDVAAFLRDYETARDRPLDGREQRAAAGAAAWIVAFNARWQVGLVEHGLCDDAVVSLARDRADEYLSGLPWT